MSIKITQEMFEERMRKRHPHLKVIGDYKKAKLPVKMYCKIHDCEFEATPDHLGRIAHGCPICARESTVNARRKDNETFLMELAENNPNTEALEKYENSHKKIKVKCKICGHEWKSEPTSLISGNGCKKCAMKYVQNLRIKSHEQFIHEIKEHNPNYKTIEVLTSYNKDENPVTCRCLICGCTWDVKAHYLIDKRKATGCPYCNMSKGERTIMNYLEDNDIPYVWQKTYPDLFGTGGGHLSYDFYIPNKNLLIEYQGEFHDGVVPHQTKAEFEYQKEHDMRKKAYAEINHIQLLEIWYKDYSNINEILQTNIMD